MRKNFLRYSPLVLVLLAGCVGEPDVDSSLTEKVMSDGTRILRSDTARLTAPSTDAPVTIATDFLSARGAVDSVQALNVASATTDPGGVTHVRLDQTANGLRVHGAYAKIAVSEHGEVIQVVERLARTTGKIAAARVRELDALKVTLAELGYNETPGRARVQGNRTDFTATGELYRDPTVERVAFLAADGALHAGFLVETWSTFENQLNHTLVDGNGAIVSTELRTANDSYKVFPLDPSKGGQITVNGPGAGNTESPAGWLGTGAQTTSALRGNNVNAYLDTDANNAADSGGTAVTGGNFLATADLAQSPSVATNKAVAIQNLFFMNNFIHDKLYQHGFNEANGNFQVNNFGKGGAGNDAVNAEAQDGSGTDNANFATPADGSAPRMQMYLWTGTTPGGLVTAAGIGRGAHGSSFGTALTLTGVTGALAVYADATGSASDACEVSTTSLTGKVAIVDRGTCDFTVKVLNAQKAGAIGVVLANNMDGAPFAAGGTSKLVKIPSGMVSLADGTALKALAGQSAKLSKNPAPVLQVDGDLDADIVYHEYGHGLTWRMIGSMSGKLAGAIGEGAADVNAFLNNGDDRIGEYSAGSSIGIRRYPYSNYPLTYSAVTGAGVHADGEIYAGAMWRVLQNYLAAGLTAEDVYHDFVNGMNFTPASPAYEDMRDGMLQSAAGTARTCLIWKGFAASGIGLGADGRLANSGALTIVESFALPTTCP